MSPLTAEAQARIREELGLYEDSDRFVTIPSMGLRGTFLFATWDRENGQVVNRESNRVLAYADANYRNLLDALGHVEAGDPTLEEGR